MAYIGKKTVGAASVIANANEKFATRYQASSSFNAKAMYAHFNATFDPGEHAKLGIYSDSSDSPDALLGYTFEIEGANAIKWIGASLISPVSIVSGNYYWLAVIVDADCQFDYDNVASSGEYNNDTYSDGFADPFGSSTTSIEEISIYATNEILINSGDLSFGGAILTTSADDKIAVYINSNIIYIDKGVDGTPTNVDSDAAATAFGGGNFDWIHAAIDGNDDIHIIASCDSEQTRDVAYAICDLTTGFGAWEEAAGYTQQAPTLPGCSISLDSSDKPHILFVDNVKQGGNNGDNVYYMEKTGASWDSLTQIGIRGTKTDHYDSPTITLRNSDYIEAFYYFNAGAGDPAYRTNTGSWSGESVYTETSAVIGFGGVTSTTGGTVYRYHADDAEDIEENDVDTTYNADTTSNRISASLIGTDRYIFYIDTSDDVHLISNDGSWTDEGALQAGTYTYVIAEWAYNNENQSGEINYIFDDGTNVYYDSFSLDAGVTVNLDTATLAAGGQALALAPGAVSTGLNTAALTASGQILSLVPGTAIIGLNTALLTAAGQALSLVMGEATIGLNTALMTANGQVITVDVIGGPITIPLDTALLQANGQALALAPGEATTVINTATLIMGGQTLSFLMGEVTTSLNTANLTTNGQTLIVFTDQTIILDTAILTANGQVLSFSMGAVATGLNTAAITASGQALSLSMGAVSTELNTAALTAAGQALSLLMGEATVGLNTATITSNGQVITITLATLVALNTAALTASGQAVSLSLGAVSTGLSTAALTASGQVLSLLMGEAITGLNTALLNANGQATTVVPGETIRILNTAQVTSNGQALSLSMGAISTGLNTATLTAGGQVITILAGIQIVLNTALLTANGQTLSLAPGAVSTGLNTAALTANGQGISLVPGVVLIGLDTAALVAGGQSISLSMGAVSVGLATALVTANGQVIVVIGVGELIISLNTAALAAGGQSLALAPGAVSVGLSTAQIIALALTLFITSPREPRTKKRRRNRYDRINAMGKPGKRYNRLRGRPWRG